MRRLPQATALGQLRSMDGVGAEVLHLAAFIEGSQRGIVSPLRSGKR